MKQPQRCPYLLVGGMSVICKDSFSPSRCMCNHNVCPECWGIIPTPAAPPERLCDECNIIELEERLINLEQQIKDEREKVLQSIHKKTFAMRHRASSEEVNNEAVILDYSAVYELLQSLRGGVT